MVKYALSVVAIVGLIGCTPNVSDTTSIVSTPRLLAVQATPAEAAPGASFALTALYVDANGNADASAIDWAECTLQKPLGEPDPMNRACFVASSPGLVPIGTGGSAAGAMPMEACELFGPDSPPPNPGEPSARPTDPDTTGGYYLPIRMETAPADWSAAFERITCQPSGVTEDVFLAFTTGYVANENPAIASIGSIDASGNVSAITNGSVAVARGARISLRVAWADCPASVTACSGAETYLEIDPTTKAITTRRESIILSWYAAGGHFDLDRDGRDEADTTTSVDNTWTAPSAAGTVNAWVVVRDERGGVGWQAFAFDVGP